MIRKFINFLADYRQYYAFARQFRRLEDGRIGYFGPNGQKNIILDQAEAAEIKAAFNALRQRNPVTAFAAEIMIFPTVLMVSMQILFKDDASAISMMLALLVVIMSLTACRFFMLISKEAAHWMVDRDWVSRRALKRRCLPRPIRHEVYNLVPVLFMAAVWGGALVLKVLISDGLDRSLDWFVLSVTGLLVFAVLVKSMMVMKRLTYPAS